MLTNTIIIVVIVAQLINLIIIGGLGKIVKYDFGQGISYYQKMYYLAVFVIACGISVSLDIY